jgi:hypothetical protein
LNYKKNNNQMVYNYFVFKQENTIELWNILTRS